MTTRPYIFKTRNFFVPKIWGGRRLQNRFGKTLPDGKPYGEAWEIADLQEGQSQVDSGPLKGRPLSAVVQSWGRDLVGTAAGRADRFPLLMKLLDANRDLSVQVHPGQAQAAQMEGAASKEETWLLLDVDDGGAIIHGLTADGVSPEEFRRAVEQGVVLELLQRVPMKVGNIVHVCPGTIHAICGGVALLEIQEPSDTTYRVYDYDRPGLDGNPRQLHLDQAIEVAHLGRSKQIIRSINPGSGAGDEVIACQPYRVEHLAFEKRRRLRWQVDKRSPQIIHLLRGRLTIADGLGGHCALKPYESAVVPAAAGAVVALPSEDGEMIVAGLAGADLLQKMIVGRDQPVLEGA